MLFLFVLSDDLDARMRDLHARVRALTAIESCGKEIAALNNEPLVRSVFAASARRFGHVFSNDETASVLYESLARMQEWRGLASFLKFLKLVVLEYLRREKGIATLNSAERQLFTLVKTHFPEVLDSASADGFLNGVEARLGAISSKASLMLDASEGYWDDERVAKTAEAIARVKWHCIVSYDSEEYRIACDEGNPADSCELPANWTGVLLEKLAGELKLDKDFIDSVRIMIDHRLTAKDAGLKGGVWKSLAQSMNEKATKDVTVQSKHLRANWWAKLHTKLARLLESHLSKKYPHLPLDAAFIKWLSERA